MGFASSKYQRGQEERPWKVHPVWRGIGCFLIILVPIMAWAGSSLFLDRFTMIPLPPALLKPVLLPYTTMPQIDKLILPVNNILGLGGVLYGHLFFMIIFMVIGFGVMSILYALLYRLVGPPRYSQFDVPPIKPISRRRF